MRIDLRHLRAFEAVAEELHFRRAAERLNLAQPALSRTIVQLEDVIGEVLLLRTNRRVELTEAGRVFLAETKAIFVRLDSAVQQARKAAAGHIGQLRIGYTDFAVSGQLPSILDGFHRCYPDISTELIYGSTQQQLDKLKEGAIDFAFVTGPLLEPDLDRTVVQRDRYVAVLPKHHPLAEQPEVELADLAREPFVLGSMSGWSHYRRQLDALCIQAGFLPSVAQEAYNSEGVFGFVAANIGVTVHLQSAGSFNRQGVVLRPLKGVTARVCTEAAWLKAEVAPVQQKFVDFLRAWVPPD
ncbi:LysR family transcriptional regulator [Marinobacterium rhizophilum]|uniref:LysR family transcriptional regulator n=1 Tax=Marinobacterium rhizophilum TaxID=420402 RepID=A0ABY5HFE0_9GAMM|nr:LysR family transcriptional regulator [Marinobacterium rhizophilum]UTW10522.1 LysR family transcriptional regulator [Marinobacterium rhizophilum]